MQRLDMLQQVRAARRAGASPRLRPPHRASAPPGRTRENREAPPASAPPVPALFRPFSRPARVRPLPAPSPPHPTGARSVPAAPPLSRLFPRPGSPQDQADNWLHSGLMRTAPGRYTGQGADSWMDGSPAQGRGRNRPERDRRQQEAGTEPLRGHGRLHRHQAPRCPTALSGPSQPPEQFPRAFSDFSPRGTSRPAVPVPHQKTEETLGRPRGTCLAGTGGHPLQACAPRKAQLSHNKVTNASKPASLDLRSPRAEAQPHSSQLWQLGEPPKDISAAASHSLIVPSSSQRFPHQPCVLISTQVTA